MGQISILKDFKADVSSVNPLSVAVTKGLKFGVKRYLPMIIIILVKWLPSKNNFQPNHSFIHKILVQVQRTFIFPITFMFQKWWI